MKKNIFQISLKIFSVVLFFAIIYYILEKIIGNQFLEEGKFKKNLTFINCLYFSIITQSTIGYGDLSPAPSYSKIVVFIQAFTTLVSVFLI